MENIMDVLMTDTLWNNILTACTFSVILFLVMQRVKELPFIKNTVAIWICNLFLAIGVGVPFALYYFGVNFQEALFIGFYSFIGAPAIYTGLKNQNIINYTPKPLKDNTIEVSKKNIIKRTDEESGK